MMSEFIVKTLRDWKHINQSLPEIGKTVTILATYITKATLVGTEPQALWMPEDGAEALVDVKLWREDDASEQRTELEKTQT